MKFIASLYINGVHWKDVEHIPYRDYYEILAQPIKMTFDINDCARTPMYKMRFTWKKDKFLDKHSEELTHIYTFNGF